MAPKRNRERSLRHGDVDRLPIMYTPFFDYKDIELPDPRLCYFDSFEEAETFETNDGTRSRRRSSLALAFRGEDLANLKWLFQRRNPGFWRINAISMPTNNSEGPFYEIFRFRTLRVTAGNINSTEFQISTADIVDVLDRIMSKPQFFTSPSRSWGVPVHVKLKNMKHMKDGGHIDLPKSIDVDVSFMRVSDERLVRDLKILYIREDRQSVPELAHSPGESVDSDPGEGPSSRLGNLASTDNEGDEDAEGDDDPEIRRNSGGSEDERDKDVVMEDIEAKGKQKEE